MFFMQIQIIAFVLTTLFLPKMAATEKCPSGSLMSSRSKKCFFLPRVSGDFFTCIRTCNKKSASLAIPESQAELKFLSRNLLMREIGRTRNYPFAWIGIVRIAPPKYYETSFRRLDGHRVNYTDWSDEKADNDEDRRFENCVALFDSTSEYSKMTIRTCTFEGADCLCQMYESDESPVPVTPSGKVVDKFVLELELEKSLIQEEIHSLANWIHLYSFLIIFFTLALALLVKFKGHSITAG